MSTPLSNNSAKRVWTWERRFHMLVILKHWNIEYRLVILKMLNPLIQQIVREGDKHFRKFA